MGVIETMTIAEHTQRLPMTRTQRVKLDCILNTYQSASVHSLRGSKMVTGS